jgi:hypothetical protein
MTSCILQGDISLQPTMSMTNTFHTYVQQTYMYAQMKMPTHNAGFGVHVRIYSEVAASVSPTAQGGEDKTNASSGCRTITPKAHHYTSRGKCVCTTIVKKHGYNIYTRSLSVVVVSKIPHHRTDEIPLHTPMENRHPGNGTEYFLTRPWGRGLYSPSLGVFHHHLSPSLSLQLSGERTTRQQKQCEVAGIGTHVERLF